MEGHLVPDWYSDHLESVHHLAGMEETEKNGHFSSNVDLEEVPSGWGEWVPLQY